MVLIRFPDATVEKKALGFLVRRFSITSWATGETMVPESALAALANEGITFTVQGRPSYEQRVQAIRNTSAAPVQ